MSTSPAAAGAHNDGRLRWLLRRGMKELDVLFERYYAQRFVVAPPIEKAQFLRMVTLAEDPDIWTWVMDYEPTPSEYHDIVEQLRIYR
ncbi:MAG: succinate dehydrogenase assembly factor 2 [Pseudomonadota bacterium]|nr:succinate dehydrogenase assembly factor 2 [Pseudomonadota bacterium]